MTKLPEISILTEMKKLAYWARKAGKYDLSKCSSGNLSHRLIDGSILISESRTWLSDLKYTQVARVNPLDGTVISGNKPSGELPLHAAVLGRRPEVTTVLHCQSVSATSLACSQTTGIDYNIIIEVPIYLGKVKHLPFIMPGSKQLADAVADASEGADIIQLQNHGQVIIGKDYDEVIQKAVFFELACRLILNNNYNHQTLQGESLLALKNYR